MTPDDTLVYLDRMLDELVPRNSAGDPALDARFEQVVVGLRVALDQAWGIDVNDPGQAQTLLRCCAVVLFTVADLMTVNKLSCTSALLKTLHMLRDIASVQPIPDTITTTEES